MHKDSREAHFRAEHPNKFKEGDHALCAKTGCGAPLSIRDLANGYKYHSEECYYGGLTDRASEILDDPMAEDEGD